MQRTNYDIRVYHDQEQQARFRDRKLEAVAFLRQNAADNNARLAHVNGILSGNTQQEMTAEAACLSQRCYEKEYRTKQEERGKQELTGSMSFGKSLVIRTLLCALLAAAFYAAPESRFHSLKDCKILIRETVAKDYTENLFDFIQRIPYTFEYEKINAEG